jgi:hypothetical protein
VFVRWKRQPVGRRCTPWPPNERVLYAALFESQHVGGQIRQRMVRCLAEIRGGQLVYPTSLSRFWRDVDSTLADLRLDDNERQMIEARIAAALPRPDPAGVEQRQIQVGALTTAIAAMCTRRGRRRHPAGLSNSHDAGSLFCLPPQLSDLRQDLARQAERM